MKRILLCITIAVCILRCAANGDTPDMPRVMVIVDEKIDNTDAVMHKTSAKIEAVLKAHGYHVIDARQFEVARQRDSTMRIFSSKKSITLARRMGAEIFVTGGVCALPVGERENFGFSSYVYMTDGNVTALMTETGEVLGSITATAEKSSQTKSSAAFKALDAVGDSLGIKICSVLREAFEAAQEKNIELVVRGVDDAVLPKIENDLPSAASKLQTVTVRFMEGDAATFDCTIRGSVDELRKQLSMTKNFAVTGYSGRRIDVLYRARSVKRTAARIATGLEITAFTSENIFPAQALRYATHPIGMATIKNTGAAEITNVTVKTFTSGIMREMSVQSIQSLLPGEERSVPVFAFLDLGKLALLTTETPSNIRIDLTYESAGREYSRSIIKPVQIMTKHAITWSVPTSVASFVTPASEAISSFTRVILTDVRNDAATLPSGSLKMMKAIKIWNALRAMSFVPDSNRWNIVGKNEAGNVRYPSETLLMKSGACDDLSTLLAACLESVGVATAITVTDDHVFILFDTGVPIKCAARVSPDESTYIVRSGTVWIPLETTFTNGGFPAAWKEGMKNYNDARRGEKRLEVVDIHSAWEQYPPVDLATEIQPAALPVADAVVDFVSTDVKVLTHELMKRIEGEVSTLQVQKTEQSANRAAMLLTIADKYDEAVGLLKHYVSATSLNNLGNCYFLKGDSLNAVRAYQSALKVDRTDAGIVLNLGVLKFMGGGTEVASATMRKGVELSGSKERAYQLLGFVIGVDEPVEVIGTGSEILPHKTILKRFLDGALTSTVASGSTEKILRKTPQSANRFLLGVRREFDPLATFALKDVLYWKPSV